MKTRLLAILLALIMALGVFPIQVLADYEVAIDALEPYAPGTQPGGNFWFEIHSPADPQSFIDEINAILVSEFGQTSGAYDYSVVRRLRVTGALPSGFGGFFNWGANVRNQIGPYLIELDLSDLTAGAVPIVNNYPVLWRLNLPAGMNSTSAAGFVNNPSLEIITWAGNVNTIGPNTTGFGTTFFGSTPSLRTFVFLGDTAPTFGSHAQSATNATIATNMFNVNNRGDGAQPLVAYVPDNTTGGYELYAFYRHFTEVRNLSEFVEPVRQINVSFTLLGTTLREEGEPPRGLAMGGLDEWIPQTSFTVPENSNVLYVLEKALTEAGMTWENRDGNYILAITRDGFRLAEGTNGPYSGWMYTLNYVYSEYGVRDQLVDDGDEIVFHYTDNFIMEFTPREPPGDDFWFEIHSPADPQDFIDRINAILIREFSQPREGPFDYSVVRRLRVTGALPSGFGGFFNAGNNVRDQIGPYLTELDLSGLTEGVMPIVNTYPALRYLTLPGGFNSTGIFSNNPSLETITWVGNVSVIGPNSAALGTQFFANTPSLRTFIFLGDTAPQFGSHQFPSTQTTIATNMFNVSNRGDGAQPLVAYVHDNTTGGFELTAFYRHFTEVRNLGDAEGLPSVDRDDLNAAIEYAEDLAEADFASASWAALQTALTAAIAVLDNTDATQEQVNVALSNLQAAIDALEPYVPTVTPEDITVYISFEGFNLGHGFYIEPTPMTVPAGSNAMRPTHDLLTQRGHTFAPGGFLDNISGFNRGFINPPPYITIQLDEAHAVEGGILGALMFSGESGWMVTVNHRMLDVVAADWIVQDGDVLRWQFSVQGFGADLGITEEYGGWGGELYTHADKTELIRALFTDVANPGAIPAALDVIINPLATAEDVAAALAALLDDTPQPPEGEGEGGAGGGSAGGAGGGAPGAVVPEEDEDDEDKELENGVVPLADLSEWENIFRDVRDSDWFYDAVRFVSANGLMTGTSDYVFSPNANLSRAMIVTMLWRLAGEPEMNLESGTQGLEFTDVARGRWYSTAIAWAAENGIVNGFGDGRFAPGDDITREQLAAILMRYADWKNLDIVVTADLSVFTDAGQISGWARDAMSWANASGLVTGRTPTALAPQGTATRAEAAAMLMRFVENVINS